MIKCLVSGILSLWDFFTAAPYQNNSYVIYYFTIKTILY